MNPGDSQSNVDSWISQNWSSTTPSDIEPFIQSETHKWELLFPSLLLSLIFFSYVQITDRLITLSPFGGKTTDHSWGECQQLFINFIMSLLASTPSLHLILLCVPLVMRQSSGSLWNLICISKKQAQCTLLVSCLPSFSSQLQPSILFSFIHLYFSFLSPSLTSLPLTFFYSIFICISSVHV